MKPIKLLHVSDLHFNQQQFLWITQQANQYDVICLTGDLIDDSIHQSLNCQQQVQWIQDWLLSINIPICICSGNHDVIAFSDREQSSAHWLNTLTGQHVYTDNMTVTIGNMLFGCLPYENPQFTNFKDCDVLLHHVPPSRLKVAKQSGNDWGCRDFREAIDVSELKAKYILCGHVHKPSVPVSRFKGKIVSNPGNVSKNAIPNSNVIEIAQKRTDND